MLFPRWENHIDEINSHSSNLWYFGFTLHGFLGEVMLCVGIGYMLMPCCKDFKRIGNRHDEDEAYYREKYGTDE